jgi:hypothetical protein
MIHGTVVDSHESGFHPDSGFRGAESDHCKFIISNQYIPINNTLG